MSATIIALPVSPDARLRNALRRLDAALAEQAVAVADFRRELGNLRAATSELGQSVATYRDRLNDAAEAAAEAHRASLTLGETAEKMRA